MTRVGVLVHGDDADAAAVARRLDDRAPEAFTVVSAAADPARAVDRLVGCGLVVGVATWPWPVAPGRHRPAHDRLAAAGTPYYAVETWHRHPTFIDALAGAIGAARTATADDAHVLFTAPGPAEAPAPDQVVFLRETAEDVSSRVGIEQRSIAWTGGRTRPTVAAALEALGQAHGRTVVVRCSLDPHDDAAIEAAAAAAALGITLVDAVLAPTDLAATLADVVATVVEHET